MKINTALIKTLNPCQDRLNNYIKFYEYREFTVKEFLALEHITHRDKCWVAFHLMPKKNLRFAAGEIAKSVLALYESKYPDDKRPRNAIRQALAKRLNRKAAAAAAYADADAYAAAAAAYADAADAAAAYADAAYAADADAYAAAADAYAYAADAADAGNRIAQENVNLRIIAKYWKRLYAKS